MDKDEQLHKELDLIQTVVTRMSQNSFKVKAWLIGVLGAMLAFTKDELFANGDSLGEVLMMNGFLLLPILCFWYLDAFFLSTEKLYRELYKWVIKHRPITNAYQYDLNTFSRSVNGAPAENLKQPQNGKWRVMFSQTLWPFYLVPLLLVAGLIVYNLAKVLP